MYVMVSRRCPLKKELDATGTKNEVQTVNTLNKMLCSLLFSFQDAGIAVLLLIVIQRRAVFIANNGARYSESWRKALLHAI